MEVAIRSSRSGTRDFRALGQLVKGSEAQVIFFSVLAVAENYVGGGRKSQQISNYLETDITSRILGFLVMDWSTQQQACCSWATLVSKGENDLC